MLLCDSHLFFISDSVAPGGRFNVSWGVALVWVGNEYLEVALESTALMENQRWALRGKNQAPFREIS